MAIIEIIGGPITHKYLMGRTKHELADMYMRLLRETARDAEDAARYRWLREDRLPPPGERQPAAWIAGRGNDHIESDWLCYEAADAAIDAARAREGRNNRKCDT